MPQSLLGLKQIKSGEIGDYITGALGISSTGSTIYASKPYVFNNNVVSSGDVDFKNDFAAQENVRVKSGLLVSGNFTGIGNAVFSGSSRFNSTTSFSGNASFESGVTISGLLKVTGLSQFDSGVTFNSTPTFNSNVNFIGGLSVGSNPTIFSGDTTLQGSVNKVGVGGGSPSISYYFGNHRFSGDAFFSGAANFGSSSAFSNTIAFNSGVTFNSGNIIFSGTGQSFATRANFSGDVRFYGNVTGSNINVTSSLGIGTSATFTNNSPSYFYDDVYVSGAGASVTLRGNAPFNLIDSDVTHLSGIYDFNESVFNLNSGSSLEYKANSTTNLNLNSTFSIKSGAKMNVQSGFSLQNYGSVPSTSVVPGGQLYLQKLDLNGVTYYVLAMRQWT